MDKRTFLKNASLASLAAITSLPVLGCMLPEPAPATTGNAEEDYWLTVRAGYIIRPEYINLENGFYCMMPQEIFKKYDGHIRAINVQGAHYMRTQQAENKKKVAVKLAELAGCSADELIITRNTTESLDMIIAGLDWKPGDEAVMAHQDYGAMLDMFAQVSRRHGVVCKKISVPANPQTDEEVIAVYEKAITPKTKLLMVCHMINITGQILPVKKICDMAHKHGVQVMVDGAHAFAHIQYRIDELGCDYYGCSLHKWLSAPLGSGMLYVNKKHIPNIWPLFAEEGKEKNDILRLNHTGTHPPATDLAIMDAIDYYRAMGGERKEARLRYLQQYWTQPIKELPKIVLNTPAQPQRACAIANVGVKGMTPAQLATTLMDRYKIYTVAIDNVAAGVQGVRVTPNVYTLTQDLDTLVRALKELAA